MNYFNTYFSKAAITGGFTGESVVIVESVHYIKSLNLTASR